MGLRTAIRYRKGTRGEKVLETVIINTGHGLKTLDAVAGAVAPAATIAPSYAAFVATGIA